MRSNWHNYIRKLTSIIKLYGEALSLLHPQMLAFRIRPLLVDDPVRRWWTVTNNVSVSLMNQAQRLACLVGTLISRFILLTLKRGGSWNQIFVWCNSFMHLTLLGRIGEWRVNAMQISSGFSRSFSSSLKNVTNKYIGLFSFFFFFFFFVSKIRFTHGVDSKRITHF